jgi:uncharacterized surface anchored protein
MNGMVLTRELDTGDYYFKEVTAPDGYILDPTEIPFYVGNIATDPTDILINGSPFINYTGAAEFDKVGLDPDTQTTSPLAGAVFDVVKTDVDPNATVGTATSDSAGLVYTEGLAPGTYEFREKSTASDAYIVNTTPIEFSIPDEAVGKPSVVDALTDAFINYLGSARMKKTDAIGRPLENAEYRVIDKAGHTVPGDEGLVTDVNGFILVDGLAPGDYRFVETKAPDGYILNTEPLPFTIPKEASGEPVTVVENKAGALIHIDYKGAAALKKISSSNSNETLQGARFKMIDSDGNTVYEKLTTDENGIISVAGLSPGIYTFIETKAPKGYILDETPIRFTVSPEAKGQPIVIALTKKNKQVPVAIKTGDEFQSGVWMFGLILSALALITLIFTAMRTRRRRA